jgi:hypothetical protein
MIRNALLIDIRSSQESMSQCGICCRRKYRQQADRRSPTTMSQNKPPSKSSLQKTIAANKLKDLERKQKEDSPGPVEAPIFSNLPPTVVISDQASQPPSRPQNPSRRPAGIDFPLSREWTKQQVAEVEAAHKGFKDLRQTAEENEEHQRAVDSFSQYRSRQSLLEDFHEESIRKGRARERKQKNERLREEQEAKAQAEDDALEARFDAFRMDMDKYIPLPEEPKTPAESPVPIAAPVRPTSRLRYEVIPQSTDTVQPPWEKLNL